MEQIEFNSLLERLASADEHVQLVEIRDEEIDLLTREQAEHLVTRFGASALMRLPARERTFFEWLRHEDEPVWNDLWNGDEEPYVVSFGYLLDLLPKRRGFLICDLENSPNFYFTADNITPEDGKIFVDAALDVIGNEGQLRMEQAFMVEIWRAPIDLWRFAYMYRLPLADVKKMVDWLLAEELLRQLPTESELDQGEQNGHDAGNGLS